ncbi:hypothetical protein OH809_02265 [Streptomyces sp. NBC_00873]|uniref:hypothetical protein n=1 Tax=unclassified Streptomyces TaxID=2593676 RepID=UPI00386CEB9D|nr:hypothetical protein OH809_02265 [Streptomyces sp. NBC_00873]WTA48255.1 hypothetical protein OH821_41545 [Streptomyces sp. NBC_00842]
MGFRNYNPGLNRFTTRDRYNGALADSTMTSLFLAPSKPTSGGGYPEGTPSEPKVTYGTAGNVQRVCAEARTPAFVRLVRS